LSHITQRTAQPTAGFRFIAGLRATKPHSETQTNKIPETSSLGDCLLSESRANLKTTSTFRSRGGLRGVARRSRAAALPDWIAPQFTQLVDAAPEGDQWLHEIKFDGYRMHARLDRGAVKLLTRTGLDRTHSTPPSLLPWRRSAHIKPILTASRTAANTREER